ncbi:MAG TPA: 50S ribosomal protein L10 [Candidatus Saccharimonadales bacterium]|nr:50S ribosomal protein L10 [Candidatus Saccharimonadales bacterium]
MALSKDKKHEVVKEVAELLSSSKMTVVAKYQGTTVKQIQQLRRDARENGTKLRVVKNRLVVKALQTTGTLKDADVSSLTGQLLYAFNNEDEVAPAQALHTFAKLNPTIEFVGAITADGAFLPADDVKALATLPTKEQLRGQLVGTIAAPLTGFVGVMGGNLRGILYALNARAEAIK